MIRLFSRRELGKVPPSRAAMLFIGVFLVFAPVMLLTVSHFEPQRDWKVLVFWGIVSGLVGLGYAVSATSGRRMLVVVVPLHALALWAFMNQWPPVFAVGRPQPGFDALATIACVAGGYALLVRFIRFQGAVSAKMEAELELAAQIHGTLVPPIELRADGAEVVGVSRASSEMGGDLIDVVTRGGEMDILLADVSGHGVRAGVVMAMVKAAVRMRLRRPAPLADLVSDLNAELATLVQPGMFATMACVRLSGAGKAAFVLAGHLPILHYSTKAGRVIELPNEHLPLGIDGGERFVAGEVEVAVGDTLLVMTDGLMEVMDAGGRMLGLGPLSQVLSERNSEPLHSIRDALMGRASAHGKQEDDQSIILVRIL